MLQIRDFVGWELQKFRDECNFSEEELEVFEMKAKDKSIVQISMALNISESKVSQLVARIKKKIKKVL